MGNIIITGGELNNKGAQAMTFIAVDELKTRFPDRRILLASGNGKESKIEETYRFEIIDAAVCDCQGLVCMKGLIGQIARIRYGKSNPTVEKIWKETEILVDISGYAIGNDWGLQRSLLAALRGRIATSFGAKVYYLPQSFGPCDFGGIGGKIGEFLIKKWLSYSTIIYAREQDGYNILKKKYHLKNVRYSCDCVLQNRGINLEHIYRHPPLKMNINVESRSIAIIPNMKIFKYSQEEKVLSYYQNMILEIQKMKYHIYLVRHSVEDRTACLKIKGLFPDANDVVMIDKELSCIDYSENVRKFDFIIASRYHSIVHAYKEGVPCIVLGWAVKYQELLKIFNQEQYVFGIKDDIKMEDLREALRSMDAVHEEYSVRIKQKLIEIQNENIFESIKA